MAREVVMPQLGIAMESGRVARWLKQSGDLVAVGDVLLEVESDKAVVDVEAVAAGTLHIVAGKAGQDLKVGAVIGYILAAGESAPGEPGAPGVPAPSARPGGAALPTGDATGPAAPAPRARRPPSSPAARRRAAELGVDWRQAAGTGPNGRIKERDVARLAEALNQFQADILVRRGSARPAAQRARVTPWEQGLQSESNQGQGSQSPWGQGVHADKWPPRISPLARELAEALGIEPAALAARFPDQRVQREDVLLAAREWLDAWRQAQVRAEAPGGAGLRRAARRQAMGSLRRLIAGRMSQSSRDSAAVTLTTEADATELVRLREALAGQAAGRPAPGYSVLLARLVACALRDHPDLNASLEDGEIVHWATANIGIAVDTPRGLVVPVLYDVAAKSLSRLAVEAADLLGRAQQGKATPEELTGGTFTISNLGRYEIDAFTPIINPPECAILGVGRLRRVPVIDEAAAVVPRTLVSLSLTFDHRLVDGAPAARFVQQVKHFVEEPYLWLG